MSRRVTLPTADDLFRPTVVPDPPEEADVAEVAAQAAEAPARTRRAPSGRVRHDEKMTVYVTSEELLELEHARLLLRRSQGLAVDRGRLVRAAIAIALADYDAHGDESLLVQRLTGS